MSEGNVKPTNPVVAEAHEVDTFRELDLSLVVAGIPSIVLTACSDPPAKMFASEALPTILCEHRRRRNQINFA